MLNIREEELTSTLGKIDDSPIVQPDEQRLESDLVKPDY